MAMSSITSQIASVKIGLLGAARDSLADHAGEVTQSDTVVSLPDSDSDSDSDSNIKINAPPSTIFADVSFIKPQKSWNKKNICVYAIIGIVCAGVGVFAYKKLKK